MGIVGHTAVFFVIWWVSLFAVLPFGVRSQAEDEDIVPGTEPGAPVRPRLLLKFGITTVVAAVFWMLYYVAYRNNLFGIS